MIQLDKADRSRQSSVWVDGKEYLIRTEFYVWLAFDKKLKSGGFKKEELAAYFRVTDGKGNFYGIPENHEAAFKELIKFYINEQPLPRDTGKQNKKVIDWDVDSERIYCAFLEQYNINLITADLHWHDFLALYSNLFWDLKDVIKARQYEKPAKRTEKQLKEMEEALNLKMRYMWELETEKKEKFKMR